MMNGNIRIWAENNSGTMKLLDLSANFGFRVEMENPMFSRDYIQGPITTSSEIDATHNNRLIFGFPEDIGVVEPCKCRKTIIELFDNLYAKGTVCAQVANDGQYKLNFTLNVEEFAEIAQKEIRTYVMDDRNNLGSLSFANWETAMNDSVQNPNNKYIYIPVKNDCAFDFSEPQYDGGDGDTVPVITYQAKHYINYYNEGTFVTNNNGDPNGPDQTHFPITPFIFVEYVMNTISTKTGYEFKGLDADLKDLLFWNNVLQDNWPLPNQLPYIAGYAGFDIFNRIPNMTTGELINGLRLLFGYSVEFDRTEKCIYFTKIDDIVTGKFGVQDWTAFLQSKQVKCDDEEGYQFEYQNPEGDKIKKLKEDYYLTIGDGKKKIKPSLSILYEDRGNDTLDPGREWLTPWIEQVMNVDHRDIGIDLDWAFGNQLFYWRGMHQDSQGPTYPLGTVGNVNYQNNVVGPLSLRWSDPDGLYAKRYQNFVEKTNGAPELIGDFLFDVINFWKIDFKKRINVQDNLFLLKKIVFEVFNEGPGQCVEAKGTLVKIC